MVAHIPGAQGFVEVDRPIKPTRMGDMVGLLWLVLQISKLKI